MQTTPVIGLTTHCRLSTAGTTIQGSLPYGLYEAVSVTAILVGEIDPPPQPAGSSVPDERSLSHQLLPLLPELPYTDGYTIWLASPRVYGDYNANRGVRTTRIAYE